jgi:D-alanyl-D-alanine carboxypeptidase (penicillin-binding protein 5/6)
VSDPPFLTPSSSRRGRRARRSGRARAGRAVYLALATVVIGSFAIGKGLPVLDHGGSPSVKTSGGGVEGVIGGQRQRGYAAQSSAHQAGAPTVASLQLRATRSRLGLPLGWPPLALMPAGPGEGLSVTFRHPPHAGLVFDLDNGRVLWTRNATRVLPVASLAKMMTALLVVRSLPPDAEVPITKRAVDAAGSKVGLLPRGRRVPLQALLYGLLLPSGNDAAIALAEAVSGSVGRFVARMNAEAAHLGLACTRLTSPDGLDNGNSSCAVDLAELAVADMAQPRLTPIVASRSAVVPFPIKGGKLYLYNNNPLLRDGFPGATGLKTGETEAAGLCLVGTAKRGHVRLAVVLLHSPELGRQAAFLLSRAFERVYHQRPIPAPPIPAGR